jgi:hypothetical protein
VSFTLIPHPSFETLDLISKSGMFLLTFLAGIIDVLEDDPAPKECIQEGTTIGDVNLNIKGVKVLANFLSNKTSNGTF